MACFYSRLPKPKVAGSRPVFRSNGAQDICSPVYLSRVVRQVSGRTVIDYINHMLLMEASFLLRTSELSISQISDRLRFADTPSFSKFFSRMKGVSPRAYRES